MKKIQSTKKNGCIVCAFPATGKTTFIRKMKKLGVVACDSDSEDHHWVDPSAPRDQRIEKPNWVKEYIDHLKLMSIENDFVFASTHDLVREFLVKERVPFILVYPTNDQKNDFIKRVKTRNSGLHGDFGVKIIKENWDIWLKQMAEQVDCRRVILKKNQYLSQVVDKIKQEASLQPWGYLEKFPADDAPESDNPSNLYCPSCRRVEGMKHCAHPEYCGGMRRMKS